MTVKRNALGRGLSALLENTPENTTDNISGTKALAGSVSNILLSQVEANPFQPRVDFNDAALRELLQKRREQLFQGLDFEQKRVVTVGTGQFDE